MTFSFSRTQIAGKCISNYTLNLKLIVYIQKEHRERAKSTVQISVGVIKERHSLAFDCHFTDSDEKKEREGAMKKHANSYASIKSLNWSSIS